MSRRVSVFGTVLIAVLACGQEEARPGAPPPCDGDRCDDPLGPINVPNGSMAGGEGGAAGSSSMPPPAEGSITGNVRLVTSPDFESTVRAATVFEVRAPGASTAEVSTQTDVTGSFRLDGARRERGLWVAVGTFPSTAANAHIDTLQPVDTSSASAVDLIVVQRQVMEQIVQGFTSAVELDPARGHVVLTLVDSDGAPLVGASITAPDPAVTSIAYDTGDFYSDQTLETSTRGTVVLLNLAAASYPGVLTTVVAETPLARYEAVVRVASGTVTRVTAVAVDP